jgi:hypothetical protein
VQLRYLALAANALNVVDGHPQMRVLSKLTLVFVRHGVKFGLGRDNPSGSCFAIPLGCFMKVLRNPDARSVDASKGVLGDGESLVGCLTNQCPRFVMVLRYALTGTVHDSEVKLRLSEALVGCLAIPGRCFVIIMWDAPSQARTALDRYLVERKLPVTPAQWHPYTPLIGSLEQDSVAAISGVRLWEITRRFFARAAEVIAADTPVLAEKLRRASPHWTRHTHATHALARGAELTTVRDNLRHASIATTSIYLHSDDVKRARQIRDAFAD